MEVVTHIFEDVDYVRDRWNRERPVINYKLPVTLRFLESNHLMTIPHRNGYVRMGETTAGEEEKLSIWIGEPVAWKWFQLRTKDESRKVSEQWWNSRAFLYSFDVNKYPEKKDIDYFRFETPLKQKRDMRVGDVAKIRHQNLREFVGERHSGWYLGWLRPDHPGKGSCEFSCLWIIQDENGHLPMLIDSKTKIARL